MEQTIQGWVRDGARRRQALRPAARRVRRPEATEAAPQFSRGATPLEEAGLQADTFIRAAGDVVTLQTINDIVAGVDTLGDGGGFHDPIGRFQRHQRDQEARDEFDRHNRRIARVAGSIAGLALLARAGYGGGVAWSSRLPAAQKGALGETLSLFRAALRRDPVAGSQVRVPLSRSFTRADHVTRNGNYIEAKFGPTARLTNPQQRAQRELGDRYIYEHWMPHHVGRIGVGVTGMIGAGRAASAEANNQLRRRTR